MNKVILKIPYPPNSKQKAKWAREYGFNAYYSGKHWAKRKKDADYWHTLTRCAIYELAKKGGVPLFDKPVQIKFYWDDGLDLDNHAAMRKMIIDGLKDKIIIDDTRKYIAFISDSWHDENCIMVEISEHCADSQQ